MVPNYIDIKVQEGVGILAFKPSSKAPTLSRSFVQELNEALTQLDNNREIHCLVLTGSGSYFLVGADLREIKSLSMLEARQQDFVQAWEHILTCKKPIIAAVNGLALGGGWELAMMCDLIVAAESAQFGQPEILLGTLPGGGATQRLTRILGKFKAMELCLTGRRISSQEAYQEGLINKVVPDSFLLKEALEMARLITSFSLPVVQMIKAAIRYGEDRVLQEGLTYERQLFYRTFELQDQKEGISAFLSKRLPSFKGD